MTSLHAIAAALEKATQPAPWSIASVDTNGDYTIVDRDGMWVAHVGPVRAEAVVICVAVNALPECLAEIQRLRALLAEVWGIASARECNAVRAEGDPCDCDRLRQIGEMESEAAKGTP